MYKAASKIFFLDTLNLLKSEMSLYKSFSIF
jgi:hypothetical protein